MLAFCGQDRCLMDGNGRIKLNSRHVADFLARSSGELVLHGLPEGALAVYPEEIYNDMRRNELNNIDRLAGSYVARRSMRRFGALTLPGRITGQGRVTIPQEFREYADLSCGREVMVIGVEIGVELWNIDRYRQEMAGINEHWQERTRQELARDITGNMTERSAVQDGK